MINLKHNIGSQTLANIHFKTANSGEENQVDTKANTIRVSDYCSYILLYIGCQAKYSCNEAYVRQSAALTSSWIFGKLVTESSMDAGCTGVGHMFRTALEL